MKNIISNTSLTLDTSLYISIYVQVITGIIEVIMLFKNVRPELLLIKQLLFIDVLVQVIELSFYIWLVYNIKTDKNITPKRYFDWFFTTPTMLVTLVVYLIYLNNKEQNKEENTEQNIEQNENIPKKNLELYDILVENKNNLFFIVILNSLMLLFGYLGELNIINKNYAILLGFIPFIIYFKLIYEKYAKFSISGYKIYFYFLIVWSFYGVAAFMPYFVKNTIYNILDLFSKNFAGIFLSYLLFKG